MFFYKPKVYVGLGDNRIYFGMTEEKLIEKLGKPIEKRPRGGYFEYGYDIIYMDKKVRIYYYLSTITVEGHKSVESAELELPVKNMEEGRRIFDEIYGKFTQKYHHANSYYNSGINKTAAGDLYVNLGIEVKNHVYTFIELVNSTKPSDDYIQVESYIYTN